MIFYKESDFQDTPAGEIPKDWEASMLKDVATDLIGGGTPSTAFKDYWNGNIAWMTSAHINGMTVTKGQKYITKKGLENSATNIVPKENLLVATRVGIGKVAVNKIDIAISQDLTGVIIDKNRAAPCFLYWALINNGPKLKALAQGSTIKGVLKNDLGKLRLPIPTKLAEQREIVGVLGVVDSTIELTDKVIEKTDRLKKGLMQHLLTRGIGHTEYKSTSIGKTPSEWNVETIENLVSKKKGAIKIGPFGSQLKKPELVTQGIKVYGQENVMKNDFSIGTRYLTSVKFETLKSVELYPDDVIITMMGSIGFSDVFPEYAQKGIMDSHLIRIQVDKSKCLPTFLSRLINDYDYVRKQIKSMSQGAIMSGLNSQIIKAIKIPLPKVEEQEKMVEIMKSCDSKLRLERIEKTKIENLGKGLMDLLLTGKVRIKVD